MEHILPLTYRPLRVYLVPFVPPELNDQCSDHLVHFCGLARVGLSNAVGLLKDVSICQPVKPPDSNHIFLKCVGNYI